MGMRLRKIGIAPRLARNKTAPIELAGELPSAVIAKLLGFSIKRAVAWNIEAGNTNPRYAAAVTRRSSRQPYSRGADVAAPFLRRSGDTAGCRARWWDRRKQEGTP